MIMKMSRFMLIAAAVLMTGCMTYRDGYVPGIYYPTSADIPLIKEKGEVQLEGMIYPDPPKPLGIRASAAWGVTDHLAVEAIVDPARQYSQAMVGFYSPVGSKFVYELYGGFGGGGKNGSYDYSPYARYYAKYYLSFLQADCGWINLIEPLNLDFAVSLKMGAVHGNREVSDGWIDSEGFHQAIKTYDDWMLLLEPTAELRMGWENLKFSLRVGMSTLYYGYSIDCEPFSLGLGISYRFHPCKP